MLATIVLWIYPVCLWLINILAHLCGKICVSRVQTQQAKLVDVNFQTIQQAAMGRLQLSIVDQHACLAMLILRKTKMCVNSAQNASNQIIRMFNILVSKQTSPLCRLTASLAGQPHTGLYQLLGQGAWINLLTT